MSIEATKRASKSERASKQASKSEGANQQRAFIISSTMPNKSYCCFGPAPVPDAAAGTKQTPQYSNDDYTRDVSPISSTNSSISDKKDDDDFKQGTPRPGLPPKCCASTTP